MPNIVSSVKALLQYQGKYLLLQEQLHKGEIWDLPGGKIEYGESPEQTLHREVKEELDIEITIQKSVGVWYFFSQNHHHQVICHTFLCTPQEGFTIDTSKNPADEHFSKLEWLTIDEILASKEVIITESLRNLLLSFQKQNGK